MHLDRPQTFFFSAECSCGAVLGLGPKALHFSGAAEPEAEVPEDLLGDAYQVPAILLPGDVLLTARCVTLLHHSAPASRLADCAAPASPGLGG